MYDGDVPIKNLVSPSQGTNKLDEGHIVHGGLTSGTGKHSSNPGLNLSKVPPVQGFVNLLSSKAKIYNNSDPSGGADSGGSNPMVQDPVNVPPPRASLVFL